MFTLYFLLSLVFLSLSFSYTHTHTHTHTCVQKVRRFFRKNFNYKLRLSEYLPLYNLWFIGAVFSNILVAIGTVLYLITSYQVRQYIYVLKASSDNIEFRNDTSLDVASIHLYICPMWFINRLQCLVIYIIEVELVSCHYI